MCSGADYVQRSGFLGLTAFMKAQQDKNSASEWQRLENIGCDYKKLQCGYGLGIGRGVGSFCAGPMASRIFSLTFLASFSTSSALRTTSSESMFSLVLSTAAFKSVAS